MSSRTRPASAWPFISFMTAPMRAPAAATLPSRILSATSGLAAMGVSTGGGGAAVAGRGGERPLVGDDGQASGGDDLVRRTLPRDQPVEHLARELVVDRTLV